MWFKFDAKSTQMVHLVQLDGIPDGPYMTGMDEVATPYWGSLIRYIKIKSIIFWKNVHLNDVWVNFCCF